MNKILFTSAAIALLTVGFGAAYAQSDSPACNNTLIGGNYGFTVQGNKLAGMGGTGLQVGVAMMEFDGKLGSLKLTQSPLPARSLQTSRTPRQPAPMR